MRTRRTRPGIRIESMGGAGPFAAVALGIGAALAASALWVALAIATSLTFHLMPMSGGLIAAAGVARRQADRATWLAVVAGGGVSGVTAVLLSSLSRPLDAWWLTGVAVLGGIAVGIAWLRLRHRDRTARP